MIFQRILVTLPSPLICSLFGVMLAMIANTDTLIWVITCVVISVVLILLFYEFYDDIYGIMNRMAEKLYNYSSHFNKEALNKSIIKAVKRNMAEDNNDIKYNDDNVDDIDDNDDDKIAVEENERNLEAIRLTNEVAERRR